MMNPVMKPCAAAVVVAVAVVAAAAAVPTPDAAVPSAYAAVWLQQLHWQQHLWLPPKRLCLMTV